MSFFHAGVIGHGRDVNRIAFSVESRLVATTADDNTVRLWDAATGAEIRVLSGHTAYVYGVAFSPDGRLLATASNDKTARVWDVASGGCIRALSDHSENVVGVVFSLDGRLLATASGDKTARVWEVSTGRCLHTLSGHDGGLAGVAFSPDGRLLATASGDKTARVWEVSTGRCLHTLSGHDGGLVGVAFSPDGRLLATASSDQTARVWGWYSVGERPDWGTREANAPPKPRLTLSVCGNGLVYAGDLAWVHFCLENAGKGPLERVWAELKSDSPALNRLLAVIGKVDAREQVERCMAVVLPPDHPVGELEVELVFRDAHGELSGSRPIHFRVHPATQRPDFPTRVALFNDGSGNSRGSGDGRPKRGEWVDVVVSLENRTGEDLAELAATLAVVKAGTGVDVKVPREAIGDLPDGNGYEARLTVRIDARAATGPASLEARVGTRDGRVFAVVPVTFHVE